MTQPPQRPTPHAIYDADLTPKAYRHFNAPHISSMSNNGASATDVSSLADQLLSLDITSEAGRVTFMSSIEEKINDPVTMLAVQFYKAYIAPFSGSFLQNRLQRREFVRRVVDAEQTWCRRCVGYANLRTN
jgi:hypothetical protein